MSIEDKDRCPFHSRAWGCRCDLKKGHEKLPETDSDYSEWCYSKGDGFAPGFDPTKERLLP